MSICRSAHQDRVDLLMEGIGVNMPAVPTLANSDQLLRQLRLCVEETLELAEACGFSLVFRPETDNVINMGSISFLYQNNGNLIAIADGCADSRVVTTGMMSLCGISDESLMEEVDNNNLTKLKNGFKHPETGKWMKPKDHPKPNIEKVLKEQGLDEDMSARMVYVGEPVEGSQYA